MINTYIKGVTLGPAIALLWKDYAGTPYTFATGWTFTAKITNTTNPGTLLATKTLNITGSNGTVYNVLIDWDTADHSALPADTYLVKLVATPTAGDSIAFPAVISFRLELPAA